MLKRGWVTFIGAWLAASAALAELSDFTGARARVVWCQQVDKGSDDALGRSDRFRLMGVDSADGRGERVLLGEIRNYRKPLLSPDGETIVFSDWGKREFYAVSWGSTKIRRLGTGMALDVWLDPKTGHQWVYAITREHYWERFRGTMVTRFRLDDPTVYQLAWEGSVVSADNWQLSRDGMIAGGLFPWPKGGLADLRDKTLDKKGRGCWASMAPDNSRLFWLFDGAHRNLTFYNQAGRKWKVNINAAPGLHGHEVYHPRWSNHVEFFAMTGPYMIQVPGKGGNAIHGGGDDVEIYLGRFNEPFTEVQDWLRLTRNNRGDFFPDLWIEAADEVSAAVLTQRGYEAPSAVGEKAELIVDALVREITPIPDPISILPYTNALVFHAYTIEVVAQGALAETEVMIGHWGIRAGEKQPVAHQPGDKVRLHIEPLFNRPDLDSERQLMEISDLTLDAFVVMDESAKPSMP